MYFNRHLQKFKVSSVVHKIGYSSPSTAALKCNEKYLEALNAKTNKNNRLTTKVDYIQNELKNGDYDISEIPYGTTVPVRTAKTYGYTDYFDKNKQKKIVPGESKDDGKNEGDKKGLKEAFEDPHSRCMLYKAS